MSASLGLILPRMPHPLLTPDACPSYRQLADGYTAARAQLEASDATIIVIYSAGWPSVIGHQIQADPNPVWTHVDEEWHELGSIPYRFRIDPAFAQAWQSAATERGLHARTVAYHGFPIDTGTIVALKLLNPDNRLPACVVSSNMYADRAETLVLGKAARDAVERTGHRAAFVSVSALSNRMHPTTVSPAQDRISSPKDDEWNRKLLELLAEGRLEDVSQLARSVTSQVQVDSKLKAIWWLAAAMGQDNGYKGIVHAYGPIQGTGAAVVSLTPSATSGADQEFDEDDVDTFGGDRGVLSAGESADAATAPAPPPRPTQSPAPPTTPSPRAGAVNTDAAPKPVGAYPHARRVGELLYLSGVGPRQPGTNAIPGGPIRDADGAPLDYDIVAQTEAVIENVRVILEAAGSSLDRVLDITAFLVDMDRDFAGYNGVYAKHFTSVGATRTTLAVRALPTPIAVEFKVIAAAGDAPK